MSILSTLWNILALFAEVLGFQPDIEHYIIYIAEAMFGMCFLLTYFWIKFAKKVNLVGKDMNKFTKPLIAEAGGVVVLFCIFFGLILYQVLRNDHFYEILAILCTVFSAGVIGFVDDLTGWKKGIGQLGKVLLTLPIGIPVLLALKGTVSPWYLIVALGAVIGASNGYNLLGGYNGLETGMGIIILSTLGALAYLTGTLWITAVCIMCVAVLLAFLCYNWYPAEVFPGNNFTYAMGALIACIAIFAHLELAAVILFIPYFIDFILPLRKNLKVEAFAKPNPDDSLEMPYDKLYDSTHVALKFLKKFKAKVYENNVVSLILGVEVLIAIGVLIWLK